MTFKRKSHRSSRALYQLPPSPPAPHSHLSTIPWKGDLCSHHTDDLPFHEFFLECVPLHCFTLRSFKFRSTVSSGVREVVSPPGLGGHLTGPDRTGFLHPHCPLLCVTILCSLVCVFLLDRLTEFLQGKGLPFVFEALVPSKLLA